MIKSLLVLTLTAVFLIGCTSPPERPAEGNALPACGSTPNCVNSENGEGGQAVEPIAATRAQWQALKRWLAAQEDWTLSINESNFVQAVAITPRMRYRDDVQLRYLEDDQLIHVRSSSRLGIGDMGANRSRAEMLRQMISEL